MKAIVKIASAAALAAASIGSAQANTYVFNFSGNDNSGTLGAAGNSRTTTSTDASVSVRATAWNTDFTTVLSSYLGAFSKGYGVGDGALDQHFADSFGTTDFVLLQFSRPVVLTSAVLNVFSNPAFGTPADSDASFAVGYAPAGSWTGNLFASGDSQASVASNFYGSFTSYVTSNLPHGVARSVNGGGLNGNVWLVAAGGVDRNFDGFKLAQITAAAVPEPATWALMILGFGAIGFAMRSRRATVSKVSYAI